MGGFSGDAVGPHAYKRLHWSDRFRRSPRCSACFYSEEWHPVESWVEARAMGDKTPAMTLSDMLGKRRIGLLRKIHDQRGGDN